MRSKCYAIRVSMIFLQARAISCEEGEKWTSIRTVDTGTLFGHELLKRFGLRQNYTNLNHGSFGALANSVRDVQRDFVEQVRIDHCKLFQMLL